MVGGGKKKIITYRVRNLVVVDVINPVFCPVQMENIKPTWCALNRVSEKRKEKNEYIYGGLTTRLIIIRMLDVCATVMQFSD